jgi:sugar diacid utilization regulator
MFHAYVDHVLDAVAERHAEVASEAHRTLRDLRRRTLCELLSAADDDHHRDLEELSATLDYRLAETHLALVIESPDARAPETEIAAMRDAVDARDTLLLQHAPRTWIVWLGRPGGYAPLALARLARSLTASNLTVAVGEPCMGLAGLRRTHSQALETARMQRAFGGAAQTCMWARDVRLELLLLHDEERARAFVSDELGGLGRDDVATRRLRETLQAWLATGSHVSAAALLGVHENTVRNRIRAAEEVLGAPLLGRRTELQVALRLERVLNAPRVGEVAAAA